MTLITDMAPDIEPAVASHDSGGPVVAGLTTSALGVAGVGIGLAGALGPPRSVQIDRLVPLIDVALQLDIVGGFFIALTGAVAIPVGVYSIGYARREHLGAVALTVLPVFVAAMMLVPAAASVSTFLLAWELMAVTSLILVAAQDTRSAVRSAAVFYAVMTQLGFVAILLGLMVLSASADADLFVDFAAVPPGVRTAVFILTLAGFGSKAGLLPLHAWLPRAHPEAPSPVSALMSAAMVNLGIYGIIRIDLQLLGPGPRWWGVTLLAIGAVSAVYGVLQASVAADLKRLLAYSTVENMGLITIALGAATLLAATGAAAAATVAMAAALVHLVAHAAFKCLGFLAAGSVLAATGLRDLDRLGGLARRMPTTTIVFGIAALGASGLPLGAGFVGEWLLVQSLIHAGPDHDAVVALATPLAVGAVALTTGLGVAAMVKAFGIGFLARPRSEAAADAREAPASMLIGMVAAVGACIVMAVAPFVLATPLRRILAALPASAGADLSGLGMRLNLPGLAGSVAPGLIAVFLIIAVLVAVGVSQWGSRQRPAPAALPLWACGADDLTTRMQYTATSFGEPLQRVFNDVLRPDSDVEVTAFEESQYLVAKVAYRARISDAVQDLLYAPAIRAVVFCANGIRRAHTGSVHLYLTYGALGVLIVLLVAL